ncbi:VOC family protein [Pseudooceanicola sp. LIPI14-2-Ac024]|uniref:VOC family protein n=1 Tax=Pseudooceanicola sp. LIPI14-2-Ac024 TaxID=3344875 RepID=UPI0035CF710B
MTGPGRPRGIEHIGITVPDHEQAADFFERAFGAETLFSLTERNLAPFPGEELHPKNGLLPGTAIVAVSMMRLANGPNVELFQVDRPRQTEPRGISDMGISHFSLTVDDIDAATADFAAAGGTLLEGPYPLTLQEAGPGNRGRFGLTPWGLLVEFESFGSPVDCDAAETADRWYPARGA